MTFAANLQQTQQNASETSLESTRPEITAEANVEGQADIEEAQPLLSHIPESDLQNEDNPDEPQPLPGFAQNCIPLCSFRRYGALLLPASLAFMCATLGLYILYILLYLPTIISLVRESQVELSAVSLIDASDSSVAFSVSLYFPNWARRTVMFPFANVTVFHKGDAVGWLSTDSLEIGDTQTKLYLSEVFHITDQDSMEHILRETAAIRRVAVDAKVVLDLSGVGKFLPTVTTHRKLDLTLPATPSINYTVHDINGPMIERNKGGVKVGALLQVAIPYNFSANVAKVCLDAHYTNITLAEVCLGPASIGSGGFSLIPIGIHVREISGSAHEHALAKILRDLSIGNWPDIVITGSDPNEYMGAPVWLRRALHKVNLPIKTTPSRRVPPHFYLPPIAELVTDTIVDKFYAYWSANKSYHPWVGVSGRTRLTLPNPTKSNAIVEIASLVPHLYLSDDEHGPFAVVSAENFSFSTRQLSPLSFCVYCSCDHFGVDVIPGMEDTFVQIMKRSVSSGRVVATANGTLDVIFQTSIGRLHVDSMPVYLNVDEWVGRDVLNTALSTSSFSNHKKSLLSTDIPKPAISRIHIANTTQSRIALEVDLDVENPFSYGAYISDIAVLLKYSGLHIATVSLREPTLGQGQNTITSYVDFHNHIDDPRQQTLFLQASSGENVTMQIAGFPNCTNITPLEASLRNFTKEVIIDMSKLKDSSSSVSGGIHGVLREVIFHIFNMAVEATVVNPVSGADIWLQSFKAISYYDGDVPLGTIEHDFTLDRELASPQKMPNGLLLPFQTATTTPYMSVAANKTSIGWNVVRRAIGGTLDVDVFTNIQLLVGVSHLNLTLMGENAPVEVRF